MNNNFSFVEFKKEFLKKRNNWLSKHFANRGLYKATYNAIKEASTYLIKSQCQFIFLNDIFKNIKNNKEFYNNLDDNNKEIIKQIEKFVTIIVKDINDLLETICIIFENNE